MEYGTVNNWTFTGVDEAIARELESFLPGRVFDIHAHLYRLADLGAANAELAFYTGGPPEVTIEVWREHLERYVGHSRLSGGLFIPIPTSGCDIELANQFLVSQLEKVPRGKGLILISPSSSPEKVAEHLHNKHIAGLKPYHVFSREKPTFQSSIRGFLPEWAWELADRKGLIITLHLVKDRALSDPDNQNEIRSMCKKYPGSRLILAHLARGFHVPRVIGGLPALRGIENVWFDLGGVCEPEAIEAVLNEFGPRRILWGSDFPVSEMRGKCVTAGDGFVWLDPDTVKWEKVTSGCHPVLVGIESLRAVRSAAKNFGLNAEDLQDIFCDNALRLLGLKGESGTLTSDLYEKAKQRIPGGTQLLSKRPGRMAPGQWPAYFREAQGCETWDLDGRHYYDFSTNGIGACLLGFRDPDVSRALRRRISLGAMSTLNPPEEVELADLLCELHPWAEEVRFARTGGEIAAVAVRIARATTDRSVVAVCGYHGWHDWYLAANLGKDDVLRGHLLPGLDPLGVPRELRGTTIAFTHNQREDFQAILDTYGDRLAAVIMEPCRYQDPEPGFLEFVRDGAHRCGAILIFDEITVGWRLCLGGAHLHYGINPDMAILAKALGNGHPIAAVLGTKKAMEGARASFISSTYWTESLGPVAALATITKMSKINVPWHIAAIGTRIMQQWQRQAVKHRLPVVVRDGFPCLAQFKFEHEKSEELRTLYTQLMLERGFLAGCEVYPTLAHSDEAVTLFGGALEEVFGEIAEALTAGDVEKRLKGPVAESGFKRLL